MQSNREHTQQSKGFSPRWDIHAADNWINAGWNIGCFYWGQFADDDDVDLVEAKIWTDLGPAGMRWIRRRDESDRKLVYEPLQGRPFCSISELLCQELERVFRGVSKPRYRLVGHSAGTQLVAQFPLAAIQAWGTTQYG